MRTMPGGFTRRRNLIAGALVGVSFLVAYVLLPHWSTQYGAWLVVFAIWMAWFVASAVDWIWR